MESGFQVRNEACTFSQEVGRVLLYLQVVTSALSGSSLRHFKELHRSMCSMPEGRFRVAWSDGKQVASEVVDIASFDDVVNRKEKEKKIH